MFFKIAPFSFFFFFAAATATGTDTGTKTVNQCNTGSAQCCNQVYKVDSAEAKKILDNIAGLDVKSITGLVGVQCSALTTIGATASGSCNTNAVCCTDNKQNGLVYVGCVTIKA